ncbi:MAG: hypothetical protein JXC36_06000 [Candidatus Atribacteria bacterium]|nr:hypothetical protein [Candidatus Atribacteria bacterium]
MVEENIGAERLKPFFQNIENKINSKTIDLLQYYSDEDEELDQFFEFLQANYTAEIKYYREISTQNLKEEMRISKRAKKMNPNQEGFDF